MAASAARRSPVRVEPQRRQEPQSGSLIEKCLGNLDGVGACAGPFVFNKVRELSQGMPGPSGIIVAYFDKRLIAWCNAR